MPEVFKRNRTANLSILNVWSQLGNYPSGWLISSAVGGHVAV
jgi:hypothetical protein